MVQSSVNADYKPARLVVLEGYEKPMGYQRLVIYREDAEGRFVSTTTRFQGLVMDDVESLGDPVGIVTPEPYRPSSAFRSPAVVDKYNWTDEPRSIYRVLHDQLLHRSITLALPHANRYMGELELRPLHFKSAVSAAKRAVIFHVGARRWICALKKRTCLAPRSMYAGRGLQFSRVRRVPCSMRTQWNWNRSSE
ncbi:MAG: hypothetical protein ABW085_09830 [Sedimenticola sp.]